MLPRLMRLLVSAKKELFTLSSGKKVGRFAIAMILLLDAQVLYSVLSGASRAGDSVKSPVSQIPPACASLYQRFPAMKDNEQLGFVATFAPQKDRDPTRALIAQRSDIESDTVLDDDGADARVALACREARTELKSLAGDPAFFGWFQQRSELTVTNAKLEDDIATLKASYDSALLEKIAGQHSRDSILPAAAQDIRAKIERAQNELVQHNVQLEKLRQQILHSAQFAHLLAFAQRPPAQAEIKRDDALYARALQLHPVKSLGLRVLFLLPLLIIAVFWNRRAKHRDAPLQTMASSHMILIALLPILLQVFYFIYELIPHTFFSRLFDLLSAANLEYLWSYVAIIGSILVVSLVIWISQKFVFNSARKRRNRIKRRECGSCEETLSSHAIPFCYYCGAAQLTACRACGHSVNKNFLHCDHCGQANETVI